MTTEHLETQDAPETEQPTKGVIVFDSLNTTASIKEIVSILRGNVALDPAKLHTALDEIEVSLVHIDNSQLSKCDHIPDVRTMVPNESNPRVCDPKSLANTDINGTKKNVVDVVVFGDGDAWQLICKASSEAQGWMKTTKAMEIVGVGCLVQCETQQRNADGTYALSQSQAFVPKTHIEITGAQSEDSETVVTGRAIVKDSK